MNCFRLPATRCLKFNQLARLYDTFGIPRDLIRVALEERGFDVPEDQFNQQFDEAIRQLQLSGSANSEGTAAKKVNEVYGEIAERGRSQFRGYETTTVHDARVVSLIKENANVSALETGEAGEVVLDHTPFYAESGGQVGDVGRFVVMQTPLPLAVRISIKPTRLHPAVALI